MPIGLRGVGKTVLLNRFQEIAEVEDMRVAFVEAPDTGDFVRLLALRLRAILLELALRVQERTRLPEVMAGTQRRSRLGDAARIPRAAGLRDG